MVVGARQAGLSISITADVLRFSLIAVAKDYSEWCSKKKKTPGEQFFCEQNVLVDKRDQQRIANRIDLCC